MQVTTTERPTIAPLETWPVATPHTGWALRIDEAEARGYFNKEERSMSTRWDQCAVGEHYGWGDKDPISATKMAFAKGLNVVDLGSAFPVAVSSGNFAKAREVLAEIAKLPR